MKNNEIFILKQMHNLRCAGMLAKLKIKNILNNLVKNKGIVCTKLLGPLDWY